MTSTHSIDVLVTNLVDAAEATGIPLPAELNLPAIVDARYAGDPATELLKRLQDSQEPLDTHRDAFVRLGKTLGPDKVWDIVVTATTSHDVSRHTVLPRLIETGALPCGDRLAHLLANSRGTADLLFAALSTSEQLRGRHEPSEALTIPALLSVAESHRLHAVQPARVLWLISDTSHDLQRSDVTRIRQFVTRALETVHPTQLAPQEYLRGARCSDDVTDELVNSGRVEDMVLAVWFGRPSSDRLETLLTQPGALRIVSAAHPDDLEFSQVGRHLRAAAASRPHELLSLHGRTARFMLECVPLQDVDFHIVLDIITRSQSVRPWLAGSYPANQPTTEQVRAVVANGLVSANTVVELAHKAGVTRQQWFADLVMTVPGVGAAFVTHAAQPSWASRAVTVALLPHIHQVLGDNAALWQRLLATADAPSGPFVDRTLPDAVQVYLTRWEQAVRTRR